MSTVVADADVVIHADLSKLGREIKTKLKPILKQIKALIEVEANTSGFIKSVELAKKVAEATPVKVDVETNVDADKVTRSLAEKFKSVGRSASLFFAENFSDGILNGISRVGGNAAEAFTGKLKTGLTKVRDVARSTAVSFNENFSDGILVGISRVAGNLIPLFNSRVRRGLSAARSLGRDIVNSIETGIRTGGRALLDAGNFLFTQLGKGLASAGQAALSLALNGFTSLITLGATLGVVLPLAAAGAVALSNALLTMVPLIGVLPGLLLPIAGIVGALVVGFKGFGDALKGDDEALKRLSPSARQVVNVLRDFSPALAEIRKSVQERLFENLSSPIKELGKNVLPGLKSSLESVATSINNGVNGALSVLNSEVGRVRLDSIFRSVSVTSDSIAQTIPAITNALEAVAAAGGRIAEKIVPKISEKVVELSDKVAKFADDGRLEKSFDAAKEKAQQLFDIAKLIIGIGKDIGNAVLEGFNSLTQGTRTDTLEQFKQSLEDLRIKLQDPTFQRGLKVIGGALFLLVVALGAAAAGFIYLTGAVAGLVEKIAELVVWIEGLKTTFLTLVPNIGLSVAGLSTVIPGAFREAFSLTDTEIGSSFLGILGQFTSLPGSIAGSLSSLLTVIPDPFTAGLFSAGETSNSGSFNLVSIFSLIPGSIGAVLSGLPGQLSAIMGNSFGAAQRAAETGARGVINVASNMAASIFASVSGLPNQMAGIGATIVQRLIDGLTSKLKSLRDVASKIAQTIKDYLPNSPAKTGPLKGHGDPLRAGGVITQRLADGLTGGTSTAARAADFLADAVAEIIGQRGPEMITPLASESPSSTVNNSKTLSPTIHVHSNSLDPEIVANKIFRRMAGAVGF